MKHLLIVAALFTFTSLRAQTLDEVINKHITALGGKEKLATLQSVSMTGIADMNGNEVTTTITKVQDKLYRSESNFGMGSFTILVVPGKGWALTPRSGGVFEPMQEDRAKGMQHQLDCAGPLVDYAAKGHQAELQGKEDVDGKACFKVKLTLKSGVEITYFIEEATGYILRETQKGGGMMGGGGGRPGGGSGEMVTNYSNYEKTPEGFVFAMTITRGFGGAMNIETITVNGAVDDKLYKPE